MRASRFHKWCTTAEFIAINK